jgi:hypothetical protein
MKPRKAVSKAQYRLFSGALKRIQRGETPGVDMTEDELFAALQNVDFEKLPERAGQAAPTRRTQPSPKLKPQDLTPYELERAVMAASLRAQPQPEPSPPTCPHENARIIDLDAYLDAHPKNPINRDAVARKAVKGGLMVQVEPDDLPHWLLRSKIAVKAVLKADPGFDRSHLWSLMEAQVFLAALGTSVKTLEEAAREMAHCPACAKGVPREEQLLMKRWPQPGVLPAELRSATD